MKKSQTTAINVILHSFGQTIWGDIWKCTVEKSTRNVTNVTLPHLVHTIWVHIWKHTVGKSQTNATSMTLHPLSAIGGWSFAEWLIDCRLPAWQPPIDHLVRMQIDMSSSSEWTLTSTFSHCGPTNMQNLTMLSRFQRVGRLAKATSHIQKVR